MSQGDSPGEAQRESNVELEVHDVAVLHHVLLAFLAELAGITAALLAAQRDVILERRRLGLDEAALEVGVDDAGGLRRLRADGDGPGLRLLLARREVRLQTQQMVRLASSSSSSAKSASTFALMGTGMQPSISAKSAFT